MAKVKKQSPAAVSLKRIKDEMEDVDYAKDSSEERPLKRGKSSTSATSISRSATPTIPEGHVAFNVQYPDLTKLGEKGKEVLKHAEFLVSPFVAKRVNKKGELDTYYMVEPSSEWESMRKYTNFVIVGDTYGNDCFVYVRSTTTPAENDTQEPSMKNFWIARVLQVRAKDASHVYALVAWMYWPDELPKPKKPSADQVNKAGGKRTYHGAYELVASNYLEVVDVLSFAGKADVQQWDEDEDGDQIRSQLYWRQTFSRETHALSPIREHCICKGHYNPDVPMYICDNAECKIWLHKQCLIDHTLTKEFEKINLASGSTSNSKGRSTKTKPYAGVLSGSIDEVGENNTPMITMRDLRQNRKSVHQQRICCPRCDTELD